MRLVSKEALCAYLITHKDIDAYKKGTPLPHKMTQRGLADRVGVHPSFINHLTSGRRRCLLPETAKRISEVLGAPVEVLFEPVIPSDKRQTNHSHRAAVA